MADTGIYTSGTVVAYKAGSRASSYALAEAYTNEFIAEAESEINILCRKVFADSSTAFTALPSTTKGILSKATANLAAIDVINYDLSGIGRGEAEDRVVILRDAALRDISILRDKKTQDFLSSGVEN